MSNLKYAQLPDISFNINNCALYMPVKYIKIRLNFCKFAAEFKFTSKSFFHINILSIL